MELTSAEARNTAGAGDFLGLADGADRVQATSAGSFGFWVGIRIEVVTEV